MSVSVKACKYCFSEIPVKATKCRVCLEWQSTRRTEHEIYEEQYLTKEEFTKKFGALTRPFQYRLVNWLGLPYYISVFLIATAIFIVIQIIWLLYGEDNIYLISFVAYALQMMVSWGSVIWIYKAINKNNNFFLQVSRMYDNLSAKKRMKKSVRDYKKFNTIIFNPKGGIICGIIVGLVSAFGEIYIGLPFKTDIAIVAFALMAFVNMFFGGAVLFSMFQFGKFIFKISKKYGKHKFMTLEEKRATNKIGKLHLRSAILAIVPLSFGIIAKIYGDWVINSEVIWFYIFFAGLIITYIFWPMENIHQLLKKDREVQIIAIQMKIRKKLDEINFNLSSTNFSKISELRELEKRTSRQRTWPFDTQGLWIVFVAVIFPIILMLINQVWFKK